LGFDLLVSFASSYFSTSLITRSARRARYERHVARHLAYTARSYYLRHQRSMPPKGAKAKRRTHSEPESRLDLLPVLVSKTNAAASEHKPAEAPRRVGIAYGEREKTAPRTARRQGKRNFNALLGLPTNYLQADPRNGTHSNTNVRSYNSTVLPALDRPRLSNRTGSMPTFSKVIEKAHSKGSPSSLSLAASNGAPRSFSRTSAALSGFNSSLTTPVQLHHHQQQQQQQQQQIQVPQLQPQHQMDLLKEINSNLGTGAVEGSGSLADPHLMGSTWNDHSDVDVDPEEELLANRVAIEVERRRRQEAELILGQQNSLTQTLAAPPASHPPHAAPSSAHGTEELRSDTVPADDMHAARDAVESTASELFHSKNEFMGEGLRWHSAGTDLDSLGSRDGLTSGGSPGGLVGRGVDFPVVPWSPVPSRASGASGDDFAHEMVGSANASAAASGASTAPGSFDSTAAAPGDGSDDSEAVDMSRLGTASSNGGRIGGSRASFSASSSSSSGMRSRGMLSSSNSPKFLVDGHAWELAEAGTAHVLVGEHATDIFSSDTVGDGWALPEHAWGNSSGGSGDDDTMLPLLMMGPGRDNSGGTSDQGGGSGFGSTPSVSFPGSREDELYSTALSSDEVLDGGEERQVQWSAGPNSEARLNAMPSLDLNSSSLQENPFEAYNNAEAVVVSDTVGDLSSENMRAFNSTPSSMLNGSALGSDLPSMREQVESQLHEPDHDGDGSYGKLSSHSSINENNNSDDDLDFPNDGASYYTSPAFTELGLAARCEVTRSAAQRASTAARREAQLGAQEVAKARAADAAAARARAAWVEAQAVASRAHVQRLRLAAAAVAAVDRNSSEVARARAAAAAAAAAEVQEAEVIRKTAAAERRTAAAEKLALVRAKQGGRASATKAKSNKPKQEPLLDSEQSQQHEVDADSAVSEGANADPWLTKQPLFPDAAPSKKLGAEKNPAKQLQSLVAATAAATALNGAMKQKRFEEDAKAREAGEWRRTALWRPRLAQQQHADGVAAAAITKAQELKAAKLQMRAVHEAAEQKAAAAAAELADARAAVETAEAEANHAEHALQVLAAADAAAARAKKRAARRVERQEAKQRLAEASALTAADQDALAASKWAAAQRLEEQEAFESACAAETAQAREQEEWSRDNLMVLHEELDFTERYTLRKEVEWQEAIAEANAADARLREEEEAAIEALEAASKVEEAARQAHALAAQKAKEEAAAAIKAQHLAQEAANAVVKASNEAIEAVLAAQAAQALATVLATSDSIEANHTATQRVESIQANQDTTRAQASADAAAAHKQQLDAKQAAQAELEAREALGQAKGVRAEQTAKLAKVRALQRARAVAALASTQAADSDAASDAVAEATVESQADMTAYQTSQGADLHKTATEHDVKGGTITESTTEGNLPQNKNIENLKVEVESNDGLNVEEIRAGQYLAEQSEVSSTTEQKTDCGTEIRSASGDNLYLDENLDESEVQNEDHARLYVEEIKADEEHEMDQNELLSTEATEEDTTNSADTRPAGCAESDVNLESMTMMSKDSVVAHTVRRDESERGESGSSGDAIDGDIKGADESAATVLSGIDAPAADAAMNGKENSEVSIESTEVLPSDQAVTTHCHAPGHVVNADDIGALAENVSAESNVQVEEGATSNDDQNHVHEAYKSTVDEAVSAVEDTEAPSDDVAAASSDQAVTAPRNIADTDSIGAQEEIRSEEPKVHDEKLAGLHDKHAHVREQQKEAEIETPCDEVADEDAIDDATQEVSGLVESGSQALTEVAATTCNKSVAANTSNAKEGDSMDSIGIHNGDEVTNNESAATVAVGNDVPVADAPANGDKDFEASSMQPGGVISDQEGEMNDRVTKEPVNEVEEKDSLHVEQARVDKQQQAMGKTCADTPAVDAAARGGQDSDQEGAQAKKLSEEPENKAEDLTSSHVEEARDGDQQRAAGMELSTEAPANADANDGATVDDSHLAELESEGFTEASPMRYIDSVVARTNGLDSSGSEAIDNLRDIIHGEPGTKIAETALDRTTEPLESTDTASTEATDDTLGDSVAPERQAHEKEELTGNSHDTEAVTLAREPADASPVEELQLQHSTPISPESYPSTGLYYERYTFLPAPTPDHVEVTDFVDFGGDDDDGGGGNSSSGSGSKKTKKNNCKNKNETQEPSSGSTCYSNAQNVSGSFSSSEISSSDNEQNASTVGTSTMPGAGNVHSSRDAQEADCGVSGGINMQDHSDTINTNTTTEAVQAVSHGHVDTSSDIDVIEGKVEHELANEQAVRASAGPKDSVPDIAAPHSVRSVDSDGNDHSSALFSQRLMASAEKGARPADFVGDERDWAAFQAEVQRQLIVAHMEERRRTRGDRAAARARAAQLKVKIGVIEVDEK